MEPNELRGSSNDTTLITAVARVSNLGWADSLLARGSDGRPAPIIRGTESDTELRDLAVQLAENCPVDCQLRCPFRALSGLYCDRLQALVHGMTRAALVSLFEMERDLRQSALPAPARTAKGPGKCGN